MTFLIATSLLSACAAEKMKVVREEHHWGMADASAGIAVGTNLFLAADDESNLIALYRREGGEKPVKEFDFSAFLELEGKHPETDTEACARIGDRVYWMGSHGRNKDGKPRPNRCRLFATDLSITNGDISLSPSGKPCKRLLDDLAADERYAQFKLRKAAELAPKAEEGLNIEGLAATPEGHLLVGFRNPVPNGKALLAPVLNPAEVIEGTAAKFAGPVLLDLQGNGIRDIVFYAGSYLIIAGSWHSGGHYEIYRWQGGESRPEPMKVKHLDDYNPEGLVIYPDKGLTEFQVLSDDGRLDVEGVPGKEVTGMSRKSFRSFWVVPAQ
ncbi:MAG TPA: DUF3616 domain-containing protein [Candidatus Dormibacteraeota bacterium]|nr:DUF3616 domain-containing protein [Candidatus Dormibacteraeota bacterium]